MLEIVCTDAHIGSVLMLVNRQSSLAGEGELQHMRRHDTGTNSAADAEHADQGNGDVPNSGCMSLEPT